MNDPSEGPGVSIVVPLYNEEENVRPLCSSVRRALDGWEQTYELILVDDGSTDSTLDRMTEQIRADRRIRAIALKTNVGQTQAMLAGLSAASGQTVVTMDGDLQNDPADIPSLVARLQEGYDLVCGWRKNRQDAWITRVLPSKIANWTVAKVTGVSIHDTGCSLKAYRSALIRSLRLYSNMHRFLPALSSIAGARITEVGVRHHPRSCGTSKYGLSRTFETLTDIAAIKLLTQFAARPGLWFFWTALAWFAMMVVAIFFWGLGQWALAGTNSVVFPAIALLSFHIVGQMFGLSFLAEMFLAQSDRNYLQRLVDVLTVSKELPRQNMSRSSAISSENRPTISVICPVGSDIGDLAAVHEDLHEKLLSVGCTAEFLYVLDGPNEEAERTLSQLREDLFPVQIYRMAKGFGEATALQYAFERAQGKYFLTVPDRLQVDFSISEILVHLERDYDVIVTCRWPRHDPILNRLQSRVFHWLIRKLTRERRFHDLTCGLRGLSAAAARQLDLYGDLHLFIPLFASRLGFRILEIPVAQRKEDRALRLFQPGVYLRRLLDILNALVLTRFSRKPFRFFGLVGSLAGIAGGAICVVLAAQRLFAPIALANRPLLLLGLLLVVLGIHLASIGLLAEVIIFHSARRPKPQATEIERSAEQLHHAPKSAPSTEPFVAMGGD